MDDGSGTQAIGSNDNHGLLLVDGTDTKRHHTVGNFSRFIRPGYFRVNVSGPVPAEVLLSAYQGPDGTVVIVAINNGDSAISLPLTLTGGTLPASLTPWLTTETDNLASATALPLMGGGKLTVPLDPKSVTTFVGN